jgi:hypothetical protein
MNTDNQLIGEVSAEQIAQWNRKYPAGIYAIAIDGHIAYFRQPDRKVINYSISQLNPGAPLDYFEHILRETLIGGSNAIIEEDALFLGAIPVIKEKIEAKKAQLVNL